MSEKNLTLASVADQLKSHMRRQNINRTELAEKLGVSKSLVTKMLSGVHNMTLLSVDKICKVMNLNLDVRIEEKPHGERVNMKAAFVISFRRMGDLFEVASVTNRPEKISRGRPVLGLPGGKVDQGETPYEAVLREAEEEGWEVRDVWEHPIHVQQIDDFECYWFVTKTVPKPLISYKEQDEIFPLWTNPAYLKREGNREAMLKVHELAKTIIETERAVAPDYQNTNHW